MKKFTSILFHLSFFLFTFSLVAVERMPVSETANPMYLKGMADKPWWNDAWRQRLPIVVSEMSTNEVPSYVADFTVDLGNSGLADSVRIVTDYGEEVPCYAEQIENGKLKIENEDRSTFNVQLSTSYRVQFRTAINAAENKCFFIYFDNPKAPKREVPDEVTLVRKDDLITLRSDFLTLAFDTTVRTPDTLKLFKVNGSFGENELAQLPARGVDSALVLKLAKNQSEYTNVTSVVTSTPFKKQLKVENAAFTALYTLYADSDRLDYEFSTKDEKNPIREIYTGWAAGGGIAWDDVFYRALTGEIRTGRAALDYRKDFGEPVRHPDLGEWSCEGWFAFRDRKMGSSVGQFYAPAEVRSAGYTEYTGGANAHAMSIKFENSGVKSFRGAAFGTLAEADRISANYRIWANPPKILVGKSEPWREIRVKRPDMAFDFCAFQQVNPDEQTLTGTEEGRPEKTARFMAQYLRRDAFNGAHMTGQKWWRYGLDEATFRTFEAGFTNKLFSKSGKCPATWEKAQHESKRYKEFLDTLHEEGISAFQWGAAAVKGDLFYTNAAARKAEIDVHGVADAKIGIDGVWCTFMGNEGPWLFNGDWEKLGGKYWTWPKREDRERFLKMAAAKVEASREFQRAIKAAVPGAKSIAWGCDLGHMANDQFSLDAAGYFDVVMEELMIAQLHDRYERNRFGAARMRAMFDNEPRTIWNHFWSRIAGDDIRIGNCDMPFMYGVNGFNQEGDDYRQVDTEIVTKGTDFYRFAFNTGIAAFSPKFGPVKHIVVFRDSRDQHADILENRFGRTCMRAHCWDDTSETDGAANIWTTARMIHADLVVNNFFSLKSISRYQALVLPHNYMLTEQDFEIVRKYVENGGVCYAEGSLFPFAKFFTEGAKKIEDGSGYDFTERAYGKGRLLYSPKNPSLVIRNCEPGNCLRKLVENAVGSEPAVVEGENADYVDGMLRTDGRNFMFGTYALELPGNTSRVVRVKFDLQRSTFNVQPSTFNVQPSTSLFALDVKSGRRVPFNGVLEFVQYPRECTNFLIGDEAFTRVPEFTVADTGAFGSLVPAGMMKKSLANLKERETLGDFNREQEVLLVQQYTEHRKTIEENCTYGRGLYIQRLFAPSEKVMPAEVPSNVDRYDSSLFAKTLKNVKVLHLMCLETQAVEEIFAGSANEIGEFLKRGGTLMFDRSPTGPFARKFLNDIGVYDVYESAVTSDSEFRCEATMEPKDHQLFTKPWAIYEAWWIGFRMDSHRCYAKWDTTKQFAPFVVKKFSRPDPEKPFAMTVIQEKVLGAGKVIFQENEGAFTTWYESVTYGENLLSYAFGMNMRDHQRKTQLLNGGFGKKVEFPEIRRNGF